MRGSWFVPRRALPSKPTLADVVCADKDGQLHFDVVPDGEAPGALVKDGNVVRVCGKNPCRDVHVASAGQSASLDTDGTYLTVENGNDPVEVYRVADGKKLYTLKNPWGGEDPTSFSCLVAGFVGPSLLALGHDCSGPIAFPWLLDAATGRKIAKVRFHGDDQVMDGDLKVVHLDGNRWAVMQHDVGEAQCAALVLDARTGKVYERLTCTPKPARVVGSKTIPFDPVACP